MLALFCDQTSQLTLLETHGASTARTQWPADLDRHGRYVLDAASDVLLNAAADSRRRLDQALRSRYVGDRIGLVLDHPQQAAYWQRVAIAGSLGAQVERLLDGVPVTIDDAVDGTALTYRAGYSGSSGSDGSNGGNAHQNSHPGGDGTNGSSGGSGGSAAGNRPSETDYAAVLVAGGSAWATAKGRGGNGGRGGDGGDGGDGRGDPGNPGFEDGGDGGDGGAGGSGGSGRTGIVRVNISNLVLAESRSGGSGGTGTSGTSGQNVPGNQDGGDGGNGGRGGRGGGGYVVGVSGGSVSGTASCFGGYNGRVVLFYVGAQTVSVSSALLTTYQMLPVARPFAGGYI